MILPCSPDSVDIIAEYAKTDPVIIPTDTLYGLSMSIDGDIRKIYKLKKREMKKKIPIGVSSLEIIESLAFVDELSRALIMKFMPGPLTIVLKNRNLGGWGDTIALRIPAHDIPLRLIERIGPITLTSANVSGEKHPSRIEDTMHIDVRYRIDCGKLRGKPSTVISAINGEIKLIREGAIPFSSVLSYLEDLKWI